MSGQNHSLIGNLFIAMHSERMFTDPELSVCYRISIKMRPPCSHLAHITTVNCWVYVYSRLLVLSPSFAHRSSHPIGVGSWGACNDATSYGVRNTHLRSDTTF